ncbi:MAG TPA: type IV pilin protein [Gemmatimonadota bacterium]|nr:type IV pilin protein [Gemmatimonadota bacterium]
MRASAARSSAGFTLLELLVIMLLIGILATIAIASYPQMRVKAANAAAKSDLKNAAHFQETYYATNDTYADQAIVDVEFSPTENVTLVVLEADADGYELSANHSASLETFCLSSEVGAVVSC